MVRGAARKRKGCFVAQGSNSKEDKEKNGSQDESEVQEAEASSPTEDGESSADEPVVIEGEAVEAEAEQPVEDADDPAEETPPPPATVPQPDRSGPGAMTMIFGGIIAGAIGYGASFLPISSDEDNGISASIDAVGQQVATLAADVSALQDAPAPEVDVSGIEAQLGELAGRLDGIDAEISALIGNVEQASATLDAATGELTQRIATLEALDLSGLPEATEDQIAAFRERLGAITAEAEDRLNAATAQAAELEAQAAARAEEMRAAAEAAAAEAEQEAARVEAEARRTAALADLNAAMENGTPFSEALVVLGDVPEELAVAAEKGVPTLAELQRSFPAAARAALMETSVVAEDASTGDRLAAFLKRRTGARSLTPQEGSGADAILSRAEAALDEGALPTAISEIETLPEASLAAMEDWVALARTRASALEAVAGLTATN